MQVEEYTIVGIGTAPLYISFSRGNTTLGDRVEDQRVNACYAGGLLSREVYTQIYLKARGAQDLM